MDIGEFVVMIIALIAMVVGGVSYAMPNMLGDKAAPAFVMSVATLALVSSSSHISAVLCARDKHDDEDECGNMGPGYWINLAILVVSSIVVLLMLLTMTGLMDFVGEKMPGGSRIKGAADSLTRMRGAGYGRRYY